MSDPFSYAEEGYRALIEQIPAVTYVSQAGPGDATFYISPQAELMFGYPIREWRQDPSLWQRILHPGDRDRVVAAARRADDARTPLYRNEYRMIHQDGHVVWVRDQASLVFDEQDRPLHWRGVMFDITEDKLTEQALRESEARYRVLVEQVPAIVYVDTHEHLPTTMYVSPEVEAVLGFAPQEFMGDETLWLRLTHSEDRDRLVEAWKKSVDEGIPFSCDYRMRARDGRDLWLRDLARLVRGEDGEPLFWQGLMIDVTERRRSREALAESEARFRALVEGIPAVVYMVAPDDDSQTIYVSPQVERVLGYTREEWLDQPDIWMELLHPDDREITLAAHDLHNETGEPWSAEYRLIASDGRGVWFRDEATLVRDLDGQPLYWQGVRLDISPQKLAQEELRRAHNDLERRVNERTAELADSNELLMLEVGERRRVEKELRRAEERYRRLVENIPAITYEWRASSREGGSGYVSPQVQDVLGYSPEEWRATADFWLSRVHPDDRNAVLAAVMRAEVTGEPYRLEYRILAKDGRVVWVLDETALTARERDGRPDTFQGFLVDITERKLALQQAEEADLRYRLLAEQIPGTTYVWEVAPTPPGWSGQSYVSPQIEQLLGYTPEEWHSEGGNFWIGRVHPDDHAEVVEATKRSAASGEPFSMEYRYLARDGRVVWVRDEAILSSRDDAGRPRQFHGVMLDINEQKASEERLRNAEEKYRALVEQIPAITYVEAIDHPGEPGGTRWLYISPQSERILGYTPQELLADPDHFRRMLHPEDRDRAVAESDRANETGEPYNSEFRTIARDGRVVWIHSMAVLVRDESGRPRFWHGVAMDITARKQAEEELRQMEERYRSVTGSGPTSEA